MVTRALGLCLVLAACSSAPATPTDVLVADADEAATLDAPFPDASVDAPVDAAVADARVTDTQPDTAPTDLPVTPVDAPLADVASDRGPSTLACRSDDACTAPATCDRTAQLYVRGLCSRMCANPHASPAAQTAACGIAGSTCLAVGFFGGRCLAQCNAAVAGSCPRGQACSSLWFDPPGTAPDETACVRFCTDDADCAGDPGGTHCRRRLGVCDRTADDATLLPDGFPCNPLGVAQCRGFCLEAVDSIAMHGVCASLILRGAGDACPDDPTRIAARGASTPDQIGMCAWRACERDCECPTGLVCIHDKDAAGIPTTGPRACRYPTPTQRVGVPCA